jgi:hypothetical protein
MDGVRNDDFASLNLLRGWSCLIDMRKLLKEIGTIRVVAMGSETGIESDRVLHGFKMRRLTKAHSWQNPNRR